MALLDLTRRAALVVGGGQGIGRATAHALARAGAAVAVLDAEASRAETVAAELGAHGVRSAALQADVTQPDDAQRGVAEAQRALGALDVVVNIVGSASWGSLLELDDATWERDFSVNLKHHWYVARSAARGWIDAKRGARSASSAPSRASSPRRTTGPTARRRRGCWPSCAPRPRSGGPMASA